MEQTERKKISFAFKPLAHQLPVWQARQKGFKRFVSIWHRRAGKDLNFFNFMMKEALQRVGSYYYVLPTYSQAKKILWDGSDNEGRRYIQYVPQELVFDTNETELQITLPHPLKHGEPGSILQLMGADKMQYVVGTNPLGIVLSEYSLMKPSVWGLFDPILAANGGWAAFAYTPRGRNHGFDLYEGALRVPGQWFVSKFNIEETWRHDGNPIVPLSYIEQKRREGADPDILEQEYYCSFSGAQQGNYYGKQIGSLQTLGRIGTFPWDPSIPVDTAWDIGVGDATTIWFYQELGDDIRLIDYVEEDGKGLEHFAKLLHEKPYVLRHHYAPWDMEVREWGGNARSRVEMALDYGIRFRVTDKTTIEDGIQAVRSLLPRCQFHQPGTSEGLKALSEYHKEYDENRACFKNKPDHDWASHGADAFRVLAQNVKTIRRKAKQKRAFNPVTGEIVDTSYICEFDPHEVA